MTGHASAGILQHAMVCNDLQRLAASSDSLQLLATVCSACNGMQRHITALQQYATPCNSMQGHTWAGGLECRQTTQSWRKVNVWYLCTSLCTMVAIRQTATSESMARIREFSNRKARRIPRILHGARGLTIPMFTFSCA